MLEYPIGALKDSARPAYWVPDEDIEHCCVCQANFKPPKGERERNMCPNLDNIQWIF